MAHRRPPRRLRPRGLRRPPAPRHTPWQMAPGGRGPQAVRPRLSRRGHRPSPGPLGYPGRALRGRDTRQDGRGRRQARLRVDSPSAPRRRVDTGDRRHLCRRLRRAGTGAVRGEVPRRRPSAQGHRSGAGLHRRPDAGEPSRRLAAGRRAAACAARAAGPPPGPPGPPSTPPGTPAPSTPPGTPGRRGRRGRLGRRLGRRGRRLGRRRPPRAAGDAARAAEREWQGAHLIELLEAAS